MNLTKEFPPLYAKDKAGKTKIWKAAVFEDTTTGIAVSILEHGIKDGKLQTARREYSEGKNLGKKNATTALQQCLQETSRKRQDKIEKEGYREELLESAPENTSPRDVSTHPSPSIGYPIYPMLAHKYEPTTAKKKKNDIVFPCYVQPKLDGLRCVVFRMEPGGSIQFQSRTGSNFVGLAHLASTLAPLFETNPTLVLDGELYTDAMPFEELAGLIKKKKFTEEDVRRVEKIEYHIYDQVQLDSPFSKRFESLSKCISPTPGSPIQMVQTVLAENPPKFREMFQKYVEQGYEGIMLRNIGGMYQVGHRSHDLQKYKEFFEEEYEICGFKEGDGRDKGTVIWICRCPDGKEFSVRPRGSIELRRTLFADASQHPNDYLGKHLTVIYQELSEQGVPRFPVGKDVRLSY